MLLLHWAQYLCGRFACMNVACPHSTPAARPCCLQYLNWVGITDEMSNAFFTDFVIQSLVHNHIAKLFSRRNTFTGLAWSDDPVIFAWDVFNEPR